MTWVCKNISFTFQFAYGKLLVSKNVHSPRHFKSLFDYTHILNI
nr:MAG TPA: hypothetical protein [Caudoviricetes sp.]